MSAWEWGLVWFFMFTQVVGLVCTIVRERRLTAAVRREEATKTAAVLSARERGDAA